MICLTSTLTIDCLQPDSDLFDLHLQLVLMPNFSFLFPNNWIIPFFLTAASLHVPYRCFEAVYDVILN